jgi:hypothetical protein
MPCSKADLKRIVTALDRAGFKVLVTDVEGARRLYMGAIREACALKRRE